MTPLTDDEAERVGRLFEAHRPFVESIARNHAPTRDDVPDVVQNVGVRMCQSLRGFRGEASITTWLYSVTVSTAIDLFRKERTHLYRPREAISQLVALGPIAEKRKTRDDEMMYRLSHRFNVRRDRCQQAVDANLAVTEGFDPEAEIERRQRGEVVREAIGRLTNPIHAQAMRDTLEFDNVPRVSRTTAWRARGRLRELLEGDPRLA